MARKRYTAMKIIQKLRETEVLLSQGQTVQQAAHALGISEQTYYRWRRDGQNPGAMFERAGARKYAVEALRG